MRSDQISHGEKMCRNAEKEMGFYLKDTHTFFLFLSLSVHCYKCTQEEHQHKAQKTDNVQAFILMEVTKKNQYLQSVFKCMLWNFLLLREGAA